MLGKNDKLLAATVSAVYCGQPTSSQESDFLVSGTLSRSLS
jgi:hypothetical protein